MARCSCLPTYNPPGGGGNPVCPEGCMRAESVIYTLAEGLEYLEEKEVDLTALTDAGSCENVTYSVSGYNPTYFTASILDGVVTVRNVAVLPFVAGTYQEFTYTMTCDDDIRSVSGTFSIYIISIEP